MEELIKLEQKVQALYDTILLPFAERTAFPLPRTRKEALGLPTVLFLGNHSSGKSSFINFLIEADVQKTGLAPTDDGFTLITYGEKDDEFDGQTVVTHRDLPYRDLEELGPAFLSRLRLKTHSHELLKSVILIDSPGMIDAVGSANTRGYDFAACVRRFASQADLILFFFDPDKPGTTGETLSIFTSTLGDLSHKLMIILHKVDLFGNIRDFARTSGTLCWNLAKTIKTKDIPQIYNTYLPGRNSSSTGGGAIPLGDFDASREEVIAQIKRAPARRADNLVSDLHNHARSLTLHGRVCLEVGKRFQALRWSFWGAIGAVLAVAFGIAWLTWDRPSWSVPLWSLGLGALIAGGLWFGSRLAIARFKARVVQSDEIESFFVRAYRQELALRDRADLRSRWESVKERTVATLSAIGIGNLPGRFGVRNSLRRLNRITEDEVPRLRREIAQYHSRPRTP